jgi:cellulose synthase/poly-beta-1,6-N-acetylglucosamine synthase-like glycosyltransferase
MGRRNRERPRQPCGRRVEVVLRSILNILNYLVLVVLAYSVLYYSSVLVFAALSVRELKRRRPSTQPEALNRHFDRLPGVSILMPAYNEEVVIVETVYSALRSHYPAVEVLVVSDGSKDRTVGVLVDEFKLTRHDPPSAGPIKTKPVRAVYRSRDFPLVVVDKDPSGAKADGVNCGLNLAKYDWVVIMDGDEVAEPDALLRCMVDIVNSKVRAVAAGVTLLPANGAEVVEGRVLHAPVPRNYVVGCQLIEYLTSFLIAKPGMSKIGAVPNISGGFGVYDRNVLMELGGLTHPHLGEDMDLVMRVHRHFLERNEPYKMLAVPEAIVWTEFPSTRAVLKRQRVRWHRGLRQVLQSTRDMLGNSDYGRLGLIALPFLMLFEWIAVPLEFGGLVMMVILALTGGLDIQASIALLVACQLMGMSATLLAVFSADRYLGQYRERGGLLRMAGFAIASQFGFRQLTLWWRLISLRKTETVWGEMTRTGYAKKPPAPAPAVMVPATPKPA